jgi:hypothetical protein
MKLIPATWRYKILFYAITIPAATILFPWALIVGFLPGAIGGATLMAAIDAVSIWRWQRIKHLYNEIHLFDILAQPHHNDAQDQR